MKTAKTLFFVVAASVFYCATLSGSSTAYAALNPTANAGPDLYVNSSQSVILQGSGYDPQSSSLTYYWNCSGGTLSSYSVAQPTYTAPSVNSQTTYNCTFTATNSYGLSSTDNMVVYVNNSSGYSTGLIAPLTVSKKVINLTSGNLNWQSSVNAKPGDIVSFVITIQSGSQQVQNIFARDILPAGLIYKDGLLVGAVLSSGDPSAGINLGALEPNGIKVISYQAQVASSATYGTYTLTNNVFVTSNNAGTQTASASVFVTNSFVAGATIIATGLSNNFLTGSFFLPLLLIIVMSWLYFTGRVYKFADWLKIKI